MKRANVIIYLLCIVLLFAMREAVAAEKVIVTIPSQAVDKSERIISFKATVTSGWVISLPKIPKAWSLYIENDPVWKTIINAQTSIGTGSEFITFFEDFMIIEKMEPERIPFDIEIVIVSTTDFEKERHIVFKMKDLNLKKVKK